MFRGVGTVLSHYRSGKLPKAFKVVPKLSNWEQILALTSKQSQTLERALLYAWPEWDFPVDDVKLFLFLTRRVNNIRYTTDEEAE
jgi:hypothetical protein